MKAFLLGAGLGERLRPLTQDMAKPVMPVVGAPLLRHTLRWLKKNGVEEVIINLHYLPESVKEVASKVGDMQITYSYEPEILGTAGGLKKVEDQLGDGTFIMTNTDILIDLDLKDAIEYHKTKKALATMVLSPAKGAALTRIGLDKKGRIVESDGKMNFVGLHIFEKEIFDYIPHRVYEEIYPTIYRKLLSEKEGVYGYPFTGYWQHLGTFEGYLQAHRDILRKKIDIPLRYEEVKKGLWIGEGARIPLSAEMIPPVVIGEGVSVGKYSTVGPYAVIGPGVSIAKGSNIMNSVVLEGAKIQEGVKIAGCVVGKDWTKKV